MKIKHLIFTIFVISILLNSAIILYFTSTKVNEIGDVTTKSGSETLTKSSEVTLSATASDIKNSLDSQLQNQYVMTKTWAKNPLLINTAKKAQSYTLEQLYEMWAPAATRKYDKNNASMSGADITKHLDPVTSNYLLALTTTSKVISEIFFTDNRGYAVAANHAIGDFDQGPEDWTIYNVNGVPTMKHKGATPLGEPWYASTLKDPTGFFITDVVYDDSAKTWGFEADIQIVDPNTKEVLGVMKNVFDFSEFIKNLVNLKDQDVDMVRIVTQSGKIIATYDKSGSVKISSETTLPSVGDVFLNEIKKAQSSGLFTETVNGIPTTTAYKVSDDKNKYIVAVSKEQRKISQPVDNFVNSLRTNINNKGKELFANILLIAVIVGILTLSFGMFLINKQIVTPVNKMSDVADKLTNGDFSVEVPEIKTGNEIQKFSSLIAMLTAIIKQNKAEQTGKEEKKKK